MKWVVIEENPRPDQYIAVMVTDESRKLKMEQKSCSVYSSSMEAMTRARELRALFGVRSIRIFYWEGASQIV